MEQLEAVHGALVGYLAKSGRRARALARHRQHIRATRHLMAQAAGAWARLVRRAVSATPEKLSGGDADAIVRRLADWKALDRGAAAIFEVAYRKSFASAARATPRTRKGRTDPIGEAAARYAATQAAKLVRDINEETRQAIRGVVARGIEEGSSGYKVARELRPLIGLTDRGQGAVGNFMGRLVDGGMGEEAAMAKAGKYADRLLRERADTIARTETARSTEAASLSVFGEAGVTKVEWCADTVGACDFCADQDTQVFPIDEADGMIPAHPNCECTFLEADWVSEEPGAGGEGG